MRPNLPAGWIAPRIHVHEPTMVRSLSIASDAPNNAVPWPRHISLGDCGEQINVLTVMRTVPIKVIQPAISIDIDEQVHCVTIDVTAVRDIPDFLIVPGGALAADHAEALGRETLLLHLCQQTFEEEQ